MIQEDILLRIFPHQYSDNPTLISVIRKKIKIKQRDMAAILDIEERKLCDMEHRRRICTLQEAFIFARAYNCLIEDLFDSDGKAKNIH